MQSTSLSFLSPQPTEENPHIIKDYPYGRLRCLKKVWVEYRPKFGYRGMEQTQNPKNGRWNKSHSTQYFDFGGYVLDAENGHVIWSGCRTEGKEAIEKYLNIHSREELAAIHTVKATKAAPEHKLNALEYLEFSIKRCEAFTAYFAKMNGGGDQIASLVEKRADGVVVNLMAPAPSL